jgi:hypothetical protein
MKILELKLRENLTSAIQPADEKWLNAEYFALTQPIISNMVMATTENQDDKDV